MRILWLSHFVPYPPKGGCFQRSYNLLARVGAAHEVHLVAMLPKRGTHPEAETATAREELAKCCASVDIVDISGATSGAGLVRAGLAAVASLAPLTVTIFESSEVRRLVQRLVATHPFDVIHLDTISLAQFVRDTGGVPTVMTHHGAESFMIKRRIAREPSALRKAVFAAEWWALQRYERRWCPRVAANVVMSTLDRDIMAAIAPEASYAVVPNGVDVDYFAPVPASPSRRVVFAGRLDQYSNRDAMLHFMQETWPRLRASHPDVAIDIIGSNPPAALSELAARDPLVRVRGFVPDVRPFFRDALAQAVPLVSTTIGAEGIDVVHERDLLIADTPEQFAAAIGRLFDDRALAARLAANGRALVERRYSWDSLAAALVDTYRQAVTRGASPALARADATDRTLA
jgi:glycosyltransferase involved in cell wall biosynthesis